MIWVNLWIVFGLVLFPLYAEEAEKIMERDIEFSEFKEENMQIVWVLFACMGPLLLIFIIWDLFDKENNED
jgi:uncharacterized membrane protein